MAREQFMVSVDFVVDDAASAEFNVLGLWLRLCAYSAPRLLGGRLKGAKAWADGQSMRTLGTPRASLDDIVIARLGWWDGDDLVLAGYDLAGERIWKQKSKGGKLGGKNSAAAYSSRESRRESSATSPRESLNDSSQGLLQRDSDSDSAETPPGVSSESDCDARGREGDGDAASGPGSGGESPPSGPGGGVGRDPRLDALERHGVSLVDPNSGRSQLGRWHKLLEAEQLSVDQVETTCTEARRLTGHEARDLIGFGKALQALRAERKAKQRQLEQAKADEDRRQRQELVQVQADADRRLSAHQVAALEAFLASDEGMGFRARIDGDPGISKWRQLARKHADDGAAGVNMSLHRLVGLIPELDRFKRLEAPPSEGSAP